ncbi:MAG: MotA/TolQ/ExbB proton channel family protein [Pirellulales bacterium]|nr:MotA/TolQ/ExbB proton channel family protein [Pirellulales bacterium]
MTSSNLSPTTASGQPNLRTSGLSLGQKQRLMLLACLICVATWSLGNSSVSRAQDGPQPVGADEIQEILAADPAASEPPPDSQPSGIDLLTLIARGGSFMIPIGLMSMLVVTLAAERMISLRVKKIMPPELVDQLEGMTEAAERFSPAAAYRTCLQFPSSASRVVGSMLLRTGQPLGDIERTAAETIQREADQHAAPIRWLTLAAAATPLMGLLGTVWGMIVAFHESSTLTPDRSRSEQLAEGIYTALVTTLAGLVVAIPAAILALYLENRLSKLFHQVEQLAFDVAPSLDRFVGRRRMDAEGVMHAMEIPGPPPPGEVPQPPPPPRSAESRGGAKAG